MRKLIIKIAVAIVLVATAIGSILLYNSFFKQDDNKKEITIILVDINETEIRNDTYKTEVETLLEILEENYEIRYDNSTYGVLLYDIDSIKTDFKTEYIKISINGQYSSFGVSNIVLEDKMVIEFKETKI